MRRIGLVLAAAGLAAASARGGESWLFPECRYRTAVSRPAPYRDAARRPVEAAVDFAALLREAGLSGRFHPQSVRVAGGDPPRAIPHVWRDEPAASPGDGRQAYLAWWADPRREPAGRYVIYFDTEGGQPAAQRTEAAEAPPENLVANGGFETWRGGQPVGWRCRPAALIRRRDAPGGEGRRSLRIVVDQATPEDAPREAEISQRIDVRRFAGQEVVFQCDWLAERAAYGVPVCIELEHYRADGERLPDFAVDPRWLTLELAEGQPVRFCQRGRIRPDAAAVNVRIRVRCSVRDADTGRRVGGPESWFAVRLDRVVLRPGERWPWPAASGAGYVDGALPDAPRNRAFAFTGLRRVAMNGASEGTLSSGRYNPDPRSVHWGVQAGTLEFWCRPAWSADDGREHVFFQGLAYGHRLQSQLGKRDAAGDNVLEFMIADSSGQRRTVRGRAALRAGRWHHVAATWDFARARLQLLVDGRLVGAAGPGPEPWPSSLTPEGRGSRQWPGMGIGERDQRSLPMQAFIGGDAQCDPRRAADAAIDELRISDIVRYEGPFTPRRREFALDAHTRALFHFEEDCHGVHYGDDRFVRGHPACEAPPTRETAPLEIRRADGTIARRSVLVRSHPSADLFERNRAERRLTVTRPFTTPPDPETIDRRLRQAGCVVRTLEDELAVTVRGDLPPLMRSITFARADPSDDRTTWLPRWRANDNVVPFSFRELGETLAPHAKGDAEKALEVFRYALATTNYYDAHYCETLPTRHRPRVSYTLIKSLNIYPFDQCGPLNYMLRKMFLAAGISSNDASGTHHQFEQAFYGGDYRLFDLSPRLYWLERDNVGVASRRDFEEDLYLKLRQGSGVTSALRGRVSRARFGAAERPHRMDFPLRPGEQVRVCWHNEGRWFELAENRQPIPLAKIPPMFGNGAVLFEATDRGDAVALDNVRLERRADGATTIRPVDPTRPAAYVYRATCPYIFSDARVEGRYRADRPGAVSLSLSFDEGATWREAWRSGRAAGSLEASLRDAVSARYAYWLKLALAPGANASVARFAVRTTFVVSPLSLPGKLALGENRIRFVGGPVTCPVRTACRWVERRRSDVRVRLTTINYYLNGDQAHRNLLVLPPDGESRLAVEVRGGPSGVTADLEGLPDGWTSRQVASNGPGADQASRFVLAVRPVGAAEGEVRGCVLKLAAPGWSRRVGVQLLVARAALAAEAEAAVLDGRAAAVKRPDSSGGAAVRLDGPARLVLSTAAAKPAGLYALWLRARWDPEAERNLRLSAEGQPPRSFRPQAMIGFTDWTDPRYAHTKMFAHYGEQYGHWSWYRLPDVRLEAGRRELTLEAGRGAWLDALLLLPQTPAVDRAAMNLMQNWNYAPWENP